MMINSLRVFEKKNQSEPREEVCFFCSLQKSSSISLILFRFDLCSFFFLLLVAPFLYVACPCFFLFLLLSKEQRFS